MNSSKRLVTLPEDLNKRLKKESNASGVVAQALEAHYAKKGTLAKLVKLVEEFESSYPALEDMFEIIDHKLKGVQQDVSFIRGRAEQ